MGKRLPPAFEESMKASLGAAWDDFVEALDTPSPVSIRINPRKHRQGLPNPTVPWSRYGRYLGERPVFTLDPLLHAGAYYVQEASSMFLEQVVNRVYQGEAWRVLDLSAAPGGKSTHLLSLLGEASLLVSNDVIRSRAVVLAENIQKWGYANVVVTNNDPENFQRLPGFFDMVVVDAPCSGEGLFRKDADAMDEWSPDNVALCSRRQRRILADVWPALKEDGILVYSTCTYNRQENEENLQWLRSAHNVAGIRIPLEAAWSVEETEVDGLWGYRLYPHRVSGEGFFIAAVQKKSGQSTAALRSSKGTVFAAPAAKVQSQLQDWFTSDEPLAFIQRHELVQCFPALHTGAIELLSKNLKLVTAGTFVATQKHDKLVPEHALALSTALRREAFPVMNVDKEVALKYLRKDTLAPANDRAGFSLVVYEGISLGWANVLPNRINNLYPAEWRIRM